MEYVGRRSISKFGCFGCHDIPGYEDAKPIGTGLADWGRKDPSRLAFEADHRVCDASSRDADADARGETPAATHATAAGEKAIRDADQSQHRRGRGTLRIVAR